MISKLEYLKAKEIVDEYENQQRIESEQLKSGDFNLFDVLSIRPINCLKTHNSYVNFGEEIIYVSDLVRAIKKDSKIIKGTGKRKGKVYYAFLMRMRNLGYNCHDEIMKYVTPFL